MSFSSGSAKNKKVDEKERLNSSAKGTMMSSDVHLRKIRNICVRYATSNQVRYATSNQHATGAPKAAREGNSDGTITAVTTKQQDMDAGTEQEGPAAEVVFVLIFARWVGPPKMKRGLGQKLTRGGKPLMGGASKYYSLSL